MNKEQFRIQMASQRRVIKSIAAKAAEAKLVELEAAVNTQRLVVELRQEELEHLKFIQEYGSDKLDRP